MNIPATKSEIWVVPSLIVDRGGYEIHEAFLVVEPSASYALIAATEQAARKYPGHLFQELGKPQLLEEGLTRLRLEEVARAV